MRTCVKCKVAKPKEDFAATNSPFFPGKRSIICTSCLEKMVRPDDWDAVDRMMRWLDIPFDLEIWAKRYKLNKEHTLSSYLNFISSSESYQAQSWKDLNLKWKQAYEDGEAENKFNEISAQKLRKMREKWSDAYTEEQYAFLDSLYESILSTQNVSTPILREYAKDFCEITLRIKEKIRNGEDVKKEMDSRDNIIKVANFDAKNATNSTDLESVGEVMQYYSKKGWQPNWHNEPKDIVDVTMRNIQQYLQRLVINEGGLAEQVEQRREFYNTAKRLEEDQFDEENLRRYEETDDKVDYADEDIFESEWDL